jgi:integrase
MPKIATPLTDTKIKTSKPKEKDYKLSDGQGLFLLVKTNGTKLWRFDFTFASKRQTMSFGIYPEIGLKEARDKREKARENIKDGINPIESKSSNFEINTTFKFISDKWLSLQKDDWSETNYKKIKSNLENNAYPFLGNKNINDISRKDILILIERMEQRNATEYASRLLSNMQRIYKYAVTNEYVEHNIIADIDKRNSLKKRKVENHAAITKKEDIKQLLKDINSYGIDYMADISTIYALKIAPYLALRPYNLRSLEWSEINFEKELIEIPKDKMKTDKDFVLPLSNQAILILREIEKFKSDSKFLFYSPTSKIRCISENTINHALHKMGYKDKHTGHGFRAMFSTNAHEYISEHGFYSDIIEACLAHSEKNAIKAAYNRESKFKYLEEKRKLMQWWADWLDKLI